MNVEIQFSESFKKIIKNCVLNGAHVGGGNPSSKILLVGQESALEDREGWYNNNANCWQDRILSTSSLINFEREKNFPQGHTWSKYQKLHDYIFPENIPNNLINFEERIFTTEMSDNPAKKKSEARKNSDFKDHLQNRKDTFFKEDFIQNFSVVVLACSDYIVNNNEVREIDTIFDVTYSGDEIGKHTGYSKGNWFYVHHNHNKTKLVIHTRQLSSNVDDKMLQDMGLIIRGHLDRIEFLNEN